MKIFRKATVIFVLALVLSSFTTGCAGCGNNNNPNTNDMVESTPAGTDEGILNDENAFTSETPNNVSDNGIQNNGGNGNTDNITNNANGVVDNNGNRVDENGNVVDDAGNIISDAGDVVGDAVNNVGNAAKDVVDGVGNGVRDLTR